MRFLAPWYLAAGAVAAAIVIGLHLIARQRPRTAVLPTARFVPERPVRAPSRSVWPTDVLLMLVRAAIVLLLAAAFARPELTPSRRGSARVVAVDVSRAVGSIDETIDRARALLQPGDVLLAFDTTVRRVPADSLGALVRRTDAPGSLTAAVVAALREARALAAAADTVEIAIVSPWAEEEIDAALPAVLALGDARARLRLVSVAPVATPGRPGVTLRSGADDPLHATLALLGRDSARVAVRVVRGAPSAADSAWARDSGGALVLWPRAGGATGARAIRAKDHVVIADFAPVGEAPIEGRVVARWEDGAPAAGEQSLGRGCLRTVAVAVPEAGDLPLRASFVGLVDALTEPCGGTFRLASVAPAGVIRPSGTPRSAALLRAPGDATRGLAPWLLALALVLLVAELALRRAERIA